VNQLSTRAPPHLWIVCILAVLWNAIGAFDYAATQMRLEFYMSQFTPEQLAYLHSFPAWAVAAWAIPVLGGSLIASLGLLLRKRWAMWLFGIVLVAMAQRGMLR